MKLLFFSIILILLHLSCSSKDHKGNKTGIHIQEDRTTQYLTTPDLNSFNKKARGTSLSTLYYLEGKNLNYHSFYSPQLKKKIVTLSKKAIAPKGQQYGEEWNIPLEDNASMNCVLSKVSFFQPLYESITKHMNKQQVKSTPYREFLNNKDIFREQLFYRQKSHRMVISLLKLRFKTFDKEQHLTCHLINHGHRMTFNRIFDQLSEQIQKQSF